MTKENEETEVVETQAVAEGDTSLGSCVKCGLPTPAEDAPLQRGLSLQCRSCTNVYQILYRHLGGMPPTLAAMTTEDQQKFFRQTGDQVKVAPKNGRWSLVRSSLVTSMTKFRTQQTTTSVRKEFLPLSVWTSRGFDTDLIQAKGEKLEDKAARMQSRAHEVDDTGLYLETYNSEYISNR